jgi:hypothetical protein
MGNTQEIYIVNRTKCMKGKAHSFSAKNDSVIELSDNQVEYEQSFDWNNPLHAKLFHKAGLRIDMFEAKEQVPFNVSFIHCETCKEIVAVVTHCY